MLELGQFWIQLKKYTDWERFQSKASEPVSPKIQIYSSEDDDKVASDSAASIASAYKLST
jgi:hypothetical protein